MSGLARYQTSERGPLYERHRESHQGLERQSTPGVWLQKTRKRRRRWLINTLYWLCGFFAAPWLLSSQIGGLWHLMTITWFAGVAVTVVLILWLEHE